MKVIRILAVVLFLAGAGYLTYTVADPLRSSANEEPPPRRPDVQRFATMAEASKAAGFNVPELREPGWAVVGQITVITAAVNDKKSVWVEADYKRGGALVHYRVSRPESRPVGGERGFAPFASQIQGINASVRRGEGVPDFMQLNWAKDGMSFDVGTYESQLPMGDLVSAANSIR